MLRSILFLLCFVILLSIVSTGCANTPEATIPHITDPTGPPMATYAANSFPMTIDWSMTAYQVADDGTVQESFPITIQGDLTEKDGSVYESLVIDLPKSFRYSFGNSNPEGNPALKFPMAKPGDICFSNLVYDSVKNRSASCYYALNTEKGYFVAYWRESVGYTLVAAVDSGVQPAEILSHYEDFLKAHTFE